MKTGEKILVKAFKSDGHAYRWWNAMIESVSESGIVTVNPPGHSIEAPDGTWITEHAIRAYYWYGKTNNLLEVFRANGDLEEIYVHIASPPQRIGEQLHYTDWELDVVRFPGQSALLVDQDEFEQASQLYHYSPEFVQKCFAAAQEAIELANGWVERGIPLPKTEEHNNLLDSSKLPKWDWPVNEE